MEGSGAGSVQIIPDPEGPKSYASGTLVHDTTTVYYLTLFTSKVKAVEDPSFV